MDVAKSRILVLGGAGLVGMAISRRLLLHHPQEIIITARTEQELTPSLRELQSISGETTFTGRFGNIFSRRDYKDLGRDAIMQDSAIRRRLVLDTVEPLNDEICHASELYQLLGEVCPDVVVDCINTATALAYQSTTEESRRLLDRLSAGEDASSIAAELESLLGLQQTPQLIRHVQILWRGLCATKTRMYLKIGTTGTGGMGLNIPYTHSEEKPSGALLAKAVMAGAHTMLLFLLGRTARESHAQAQWSPDRNIKAPAPIIKEVKPAAAIAWKGIHYGAIRSRGAALPLYDHNPELAMPLELALQASEGPWERCGQEMLHAPFIDTGENGIFSRGEFEAITEEGQMEFVTPEEIAEAVEKEILGGNSGKDLVSALDGAVLGPSYRAGFLRSRALESLSQLERQKGVPSIAFENLGPPRLSKLLYELHLILKEHELLDPPRYDADALATLCESRLLCDKELRTAILSIGLGIMLRSGKVLRGQRFLTPSQLHASERPLTKEDIDYIANYAMLDLRPANFKRWLTRLAVLREEAQRESSEHSGSLYVRNRAYWEMVAKNGSLGSVVAWIFLREEDGERVK